MFSRRLFNGCMIMLAVIIAVGGCSEERNDVDGTDVVDNELAPIVDWLAGDDSGVVSNLAHDASTDQPPVSSMIEGLEAKLAKNPDDVKGWTLLAQSYAYVGQMSDAKSAAKKAVELGASELALQAKIESAHTGLAR